MPQSVYPTKCKVLYSNLSMTQELHEWWNKCYRCSACLPACLSLLASHSFSLSLKMKELSPGSCSAVSHVRGPGSTYYQHSIKKNSNFFRAVDPFWKSSQWGFQMKMWLFVFSSKHVLALPFHSLYLTCSGPLPKQTNKSSLEKLITVLQTHQFPLSSNKDFKRERKARKEKCIYNVSQFWPT